MSQKPVRKRSVVKWVLVGLGILVVVVLVGVGVAVLATGGQRRADSRLEIADIDFSEVPDGTYRGSYEGWNKFDVIVTVVGGEVTEIAIDDESPMGATGTTDKVLERVVGDQSLEVDAVSGATVTTKALLKAVEDALVSQRSE